MLALLLALACAHSPQQATMSTVPSALDTRPSVGTSPTFQPPAPTEFTVANGARVWLIERPEIPLVSLRLVIDGGSATDPIDHPGLTALADTMLVHGAADRDASAFARASERLAITLDVSTDTRHTVFNLACQANRLDEGLDLLADAVLQPRFDPDEVQRMIELRQGELTRELDEPRSVAVNVARRAYYGADDPRGHSPQGTAWGIADLDASALKTSWLSRNSPDHAHFVVAGAVDQASLTASIDAHFGDWNTAASPLPELPPVAPPTPGPHLYLVDNPGAAQSVLRVLVPGPSAQDAQLQPDRMGVIVLGGTFTSRLNRLLREEKGYTYGASARVQPMADHGLIIAQSSVRADVTGPALADLLGELNRIRDGVDDAETLKAKASNLTSIVGLMDSRGAIASTFADLATQGASADAMQTRLAQAQAVDTAAINAALEDLQPDTATVVVVGDLATIQAPLEQAVPGDWRVMSKEPSAP